MRIIIYTQDKEYEFDKKTVVRLLALLLLLLGFIFGLIFMISEYYSYDKIKAEVITLFEEDNPCYQIYDSPFDLEQLNLPPINISGLK